MVELSRRQVVRGAMAILASVGIAETSKAAEAKTMSVGFIHVFAFQWKSQTTAEQIEKARREIASFQGVIPGLVSTNVGQNHSEKNKGYSFGGVMQFTDQAAFEAYTVHPAHKKLLAWLVPLIDAMELDIQG